MLQILPHSLTLFLLSPQEADLVVRFLPELVLVMMEPSLRAVHLKLKQEHSALDPALTFVSHIASSQEAMLLACSYALHLVEKRDFKTLSQLLPAIAKAYISSERDIMPDGFLHSLVVMLVPHVAGLREAQLLPIMKDFWAQCAQHSETALLYCCRLLWACHDKLKPAYLLTDLLELITPSEQARGCPYLLNTFHYLSLHR